MLLPTLKQLEHSPGGLSSFKAKPGKGWAFYPEFQREVGAKDKARSLEDNAHPSLIWGIPKGVVLSGTGFWGRTAIPAPRSCPLITNSLSLFLLI